MLEKYFITLKIILHDLEIPFEENQSILNENPHFHSVELISDETDLTPFCILEH